MGLAVIVRHGVSRGVVLDGLFDDGDLLVDGCAALLEVLVDEAAREAADNVFGFPCDDGESVGDSAFDERGHHLGERLVASETDGRSGGVQSAGSKLTSGEADGGAQHSGEVENQGSEEKSS
jgi:hypothetical protein